MNVKKIQDLEQEKSFTDQRRQLAKDAFEKEQVSLSLVVVTVVRVVCDSNP